MEDGSCGLVSMLGVCEPNVGVPSCGAGGGPNCNGPEVCNGLDDDCDGLVDEGVPGVNEPCAVPNKQGECAFGSTVCSKGQIACLQNVGASVEICDGKDNNCDGVIDNNPADVGSQCVTGQKGLCSQGTLKCEGGETKCVANFAPTDESCNGFDDNCDGNVDEGFPGAGQPCTIPNLQGPCAQGQTTCQNNGVSCAQAVFPQAETCDGKDNDCNGLVDDKCQGAGGAGGAAGSGGAGGSSGSMDAALSLPPPGAQACQNEGTTGGDCGSDFLMCRIFGPDEGRCEGCSPCGKAGDACNASVKCATTNQCYGGVCRELCLLSDPAACKQGGTCKAVGNKDAGVCVP